MKKIILRLLVICGLLVSSTLNSIPAIAETPANVWYVKPGGTGTFCNSWAEACDLQYVIENSLLQAGDEIWVAEGLYYPGDVISSSFQVNKSINLYGGFVGTENSPAERNWEEHPSILSGDIDHNDLTEGGVVTDTANITGTNALHVVMSEGITSTEVLLDGFTITAGYADGAIFPDERMGGGLFNPVSRFTLQNDKFIGNLAYQGGAISNQMGALTLTNVTFSNNVADGGGGIYNGSGMINLTGGTFSNNKANDAGGGIANTFGQITLTHVTFSNNQAWKGGGIYTFDIATLVNAVFSGNQAEVGGGLYNATYSSTTLSHATFSNNQAAQQGGGVYNGQYAFATFTDATFLGNRATYGGGIFNHGGGPVNKATFSGQQIKVGGGIGEDINSIYSIIRLTNATFSGNLATYGGGIDNYNLGQANLTNIVFNGNQADYGGGVYDDLNLVTTLTNVTVANNQAAIRGGGIDNTSSRATLINSILWGNYAPTDAQIHNENGTIDITYSDIQGWMSDPEKHIINTDPLFMNMTGSNLHLLAPSPAIDAGNNSAEGLIGITTDLDGKPRFVDVPWIADSGTGTPPIVDLGAYEFQTAEFQIFKALLPLLVK